jgi:hypothetical protein
VTIATYAIGREPQGLTYNCFEKNLFDAATFHFIELDAGNPVQIKFHVLVN